MARRIYPKRYAQAVFSLAQERGELDRWQADLKKVAILGRDAVLRAWLESPKIRFADKAKLLSEQLADINPLALNLVQLLIARGRLSMVADIADEYQRRLDSYHGLEHAEIITALPLDDEDRLKVEERLSVMTGKKVVLEPKVDAAVIGGVVVRIGDKLLDGSTRNKLESLRRALVGAER